MSKRLYNEGTTNMSIIVPNSLRHKLDQLKATNQIQNFNYLINNLLKKFVESKTKNKELIELVDDYIERAKGDNYEAMYLLAEQFNKVTNKIYGLNAKYKKSKLKESETDETKQTD